MSIILVSGASGFIGSYLVRSLAGGNELHGLVRTVPTGQRLAGVRWIQQDLTQPLDESRFPGRVDAVVHLAQSRHYKQFPDRADDIFAVNMGGTFRLLEYARKAGARHFMFASSGGIYGYSYEKCVESDPVRPLNFYLSSKYSAELMIANYQPFFRTVVFRLFFVYGPGQKGMLIPTLLGKVTRGEPITIEGDPGIRINPIHVEDAVRVFEPALRLEKSALFNVAGPEVLTTTDLVRLMEQATGRKAVVRHTEAALQGDLVGDSARMVRELGVRPGIGLLAGLREMVQAGPQGAPA